MNESVIDKLKDRKVIQWSLGYVAAAWVAAQVAEVVTGPWGLPLQWIRYLHVILIAGLPLAITLAWFHGDRGHQRLTRAEAALLAVIIAGASYAMVTIDVSDEAMGTPSTAAITGSIPRLAVLAFSNLGSPEDAFFADGITAELGSRLSGLSGLALMSPSSAKAYKGSGQTPRQFGRSLGADYVLSGTVQWDRARDGQTKIRVIPEVIRVADDTQIWSSQLDQAFEDTLMMQADIALHVIDELKITMSMAEREVVDYQLTGNPLAYEAYLKGIQVLPAGHGAESDYRKARQLLLQATMLDPEFVEAWAALADADLGLYWFGYDASPSRMEIARASLDRALQLDPASHVARFREGDLFYRLRDFSAAMKTWSELFEKRPNDAALMQFMGYLWRRQGLLEQGIDALERASLLDPLNAYLLIETAWTHAVNGNLERASELLAQSQQADPNEDWTYLSGAMYCWTAGGPDALRCSREFLERFPNPRSLYPAWYWMQQHLMEGHPQAALDLMENYPEPELLLQAFYIPIEQIRGSLLLALGREEEARPLLEAAIEHLLDRWSANPNDFRLPIGLARAYADLGLKEQALAAVDQATGLLPLEKDALTGADLLFEVAGIYATLGEDGLALDTMAKLHSVPSMYRNTWWTDNPAFARLRDMPRFQRLLARQ